MKSDGRSRRHTWGPFTQAGRARKHPRWAFGSFTLALVAVIFVGSESMAGIRGGVARIDLTPPTGHSMSGYGARRGVSSGVLDPLFAQALTLDDGKQSVALVTLDLIFTLGRAEMDAIRTRVRGSTGIDDVVFVASHTHSGPTFSDIPDWYEKSVLAVAGAIEKAHGQAVEVRLGTGWGISQIGFNRRYVPPDGPTRMRWRNATRASTFPIDPSVGVIRVDRSDGTPLAILVNYACHPVVLGPDNMEY